jgi:predicted  nucleic acid-binding Zn-ribbon protein
MATLAELIRDMHRLHRLLRDLQQEIADAPRERAAELARLTHAETKLKEGQDRLKHLKVQVHERETTLKGLYQQTKKYEKQRETATSKKELDAFDHEIEHAKKQCSELEDKILQGLSDIDEQTAVIPVLERELAQVRQEVAQYEAQAGERLQRLERERDSAQQQLRALEETLPEDIVPTYRRLIKSMGAEAMAPLVDRVCQGCMTTQTLQRFYDLQAGRFITCSNCGRALYLAGP